MARSVEELRRESELGRARLVATVDQVRERITHTAEDLRYKVSPEGLKSEVSDFVSRKTQSWLGALKQQAMENPMQAIAAGTAIAVPALRLARGFPLPLLMIGVGLALSSKTVRARAAEAAAPAIEKARELAGEATERAQSLGEDVAETASATGRRAADIAGEAQTRAAGIADELNGRAGEVTDKVKASINAASETAKDTIERARSSARETASAAPEAARKVIGDNAALIGSLGVALGAIIAASLPDSKAEVAVIGKASDGVKRAAGKVAQSSFETAKDAVLSAADTAAKSVADADLGQHASRMTHDASDRLKEAADDIVTAANPTPNSKESPS
jgi:vacuolar-type H+-ATPase subunit H